MALSNSIFFICLGQYIPLHLLLFHLIMKQVFEFFSFYFVCRESERATGGMKEITMWNIVGDRLSESQPMKWWKQTMSLSHNKTTETTRKGEKFRHWILSIDSLRGRNLREPKKKKTPNKHKGRRIWTTCFSVTNMFYYKVSELNCYLVCKDTEV